MTYEAAVQASKIISEIKNLSDKKEKFEKANWVDIVFRRETGPVCEEIQCTKGGMHQNYICYIIEGLEKDIKKLREKLSRL